MARSKGVSKLFSCIDSRILTIAEEDLANSGIPLNYAAANGVDIRDPQQAAPLFKKLNIPPGPAAIIYRYVTLNEKGIVAPIAENEFLRFKPLVIEQVLGFAAQTKPKSKYLQIGTGSHIYIPTVHSNLEPINWAEFLKVGESIKITEGEKKALSAMFRGIYAVAVGGVDNIYVSKYDKKLLPELEILARKRKCYIVFDIDQGHTSYKPEVARSAERLQRELSNIGCEVFVTILPSRKEQKTGLDDWLVLNPNTPLEVLEEEIIKYSYPSATSSVLTKEFNNKVFLTVQKAVADVTTRELLPLDNYEKGKGNMQVVVNELKICKHEELGFVTRCVPKVTTLANAFVTSHARPTVSKVNIFPGDPRAIIEEEDSFNMWSGWAQKLPEVPPSRKDLDVFFEFMEGFHGKDAEFMINWFLWALKHPGDKLFTIPVLKHSAEGIGKSTIAELVGEYVYGKEFWTVIGADKLNKMSFKVELVGGKLLTVIDDADDVELSSMMSAIKGIVTQKFITVVYKYMNKATIRNFTNVITNTNREKPFYITKNDRRFVFPECTDKYKEVKGKIHEIFRRLHKWFEEGGGGKLVSYAIHVHDFKKFDPKSSAPLTISKQEQIAMSETPLQECVKKVMANTKEIEREVHTFTTLKAMLEQMLRDSGYENYRYNYAQLVSSLKEEGAVSLGVVNYKGTTCSVYALKNQKKWASRSVNEIKEELDKELIMKKKSEEEIQKEGKVKADVIELSKRITGRKTPKYEK